MGFSCSPFPSPLKIDIHAGFGEAAIKVFSSCRLLALIILLFFQQAIAGRVLP